MNCVSPDRTLTPMRVATFGEEPSHTLLTADEVADVSLAALFSDRTGQLVNVRLPEGGEGGVRRRTTGGVRTDLGHHSAVDAGHTDTRPDDGLGHSPRGRESVESGGPEKLASRS